MPTAAPELPAIADQTTFNIGRWSILCADPFFASLDHRIETDANGNVLMSPPPAFDHSDRQGEVLKLLLQHAPPEGSALPESPLSTSGGVKAIDVTWISKGRRVRAVDGNLLIIAPEICVEVLSPSNTRSEIDEKRRLYFEAGADEVWICGLDRSMRFFVAADPDGEPQLASSICPDFPRSIPSTE
jgi:Uma2 family endonuclease